LPGDVIDCKITAMAALQEHLGDDGAGAPRTLGDVLYAGMSAAPGSEEDWVALVRGIAAGDQVALHGLYERSDRLVFTLIMGITSSRETAEELTLEVFHNVWRRAYRYDPRNGTVLGWLMNQARSRVLARLCSDQRKKGDEAEFEDERRALSTAPDPLTLQERLAHRIAQDTGEPAGLPGKHRWSEPQWEDVAPGISCKVLAYDNRQHLVSMLVRLAPGGAYPPHTHAGVEELHLLEGELWIDDRKLYAGDYNRADPGTGDRRVWSETGCTCVLVTSTKDVLT
jgi:DNA-directed RNA polymerase specialized sigma24 family protein